LGLTGLSGEVGAELVEHERTRGGALFAPTGRDGLLALVARQQLDDLLTNPSEVGAELDQHLSGYSLALADQAEQNVLGADVAVFEKFRFFLCEHHDAACSVGEPLEHIHPPRSSYSSEPNDDQRGSIAGFAMSRNRLAVGE